MSMADVIFKNMCADIIAHGTDTKGQEVRPVWPDTGEKAYTIKQFGVCNTYDLRKEFPAITFRKTFIKSSIQEVLWIYQMKSNNIKDLGLHIWDEWADENGTIGKAYGYQIGKRYVHHLYSKELGFDPKCYQWDSAKPTPMDEEVFKKYSKDYSSARPFYDLMNKRVYIELDQMDAVLYDLKHTPFSRRIMTNTFNFDELFEMGLQPCAYSTTWNVTDENDDKLILNMVLNQRSQDILAANNWNVCQYAALLMMAAQSCDMIPGKLVHMIADAHIYDRHVGIIKGLIQRPMYPAPIFKMNPDKKDFYEFTPEDFTLESYTTGEQVKNIPVAV